MKRLLPQDTLIFVSRSLDTSTHICPRHNDQKSGAIVAAAGDETLVMDLHVPKGDAA